MTHAYLVQCLLSLPNCTKPAVAGVARRIVQMFLASGLDDDLVGVDSDLQHPMRR